MQSVRSSSFFTRINACRLSVFHGLYNILAERLSPGSVHWLGCGVHGLGLVSRSGLVGRLGNGLVNRLRGGLVGGLGGLVGGCGSRLVM